MNIEHFLPSSFWWDDLVSEKLLGETGFSIIKTKQMSHIRIRQVEHSVNYLADHWCDKGHVVIISEGELTIEHKDGSIHKLTKGMVYLVGDNSSSHQARSEKGAVVFIVD